MEWATAAEFGLSLAEGLSGENPQALNGPAYFEPYNPVYINLEGVGAQAPKPSGLLDFSIGENLNPSTLTGAIVTGVIVGSVMLAVTAIMKSK